MSSQQFIRYSACAHQIQSGDLLRWGSEQLGKIRLVNRECVTTLRSPDREDVVFANRMKVVSFVLGEFGMFVCWASPSKGDGTREPIVYVPRFALYNTWHGWYLDGADWNERIYERSHG